MKIQSLQNDLYRVVLQADKIEKLNLLQAKNFFIYLVI